MVLYGIAIAFIFALWLRNVFFVPWYAARVQGVPPAVFYKPVVPSILAFLVLIFIGLFYDIIFYRFSINNLYSRYSLV